MTPSPKKTKVEPNVALNGSCNRHRKTELKISEHAIGQAQQ